MWDNYPFFFFFFFEKQTHTQGREKGVLTQKHTTSSLKSHGNIDALLIVSTNGLMLLYARQICLGSRCVKTCWNSVLSIKLC